jgi:hypothetical protein
MFFIDNHVSNGADYQYKLTYIMTQQNRERLGTYLDKMMPSIVLDLKKNIETTPYVNAFSETPDNGFMQFLTVLDIRQATLLI